MLTNLVGAVIIERDGPTRLLFHPRAQERDLVQYAPGRVIGYVQCVAAAALRETVRSDDPDIEDAVHRGLTAARALHIAGYEPGSPGGRRSGLSAHDGRARHQGQARGTVRRLDLVRERRRPPHPLRGPRRGESRAVAARAAVEGPEKLLAGIPIETVGAWSSVDRDEIESMRSVRGIMAEYVEQLEERQAPRAPALDRGVRTARRRQVVRRQTDRQALLPGELKTLEFNLSQFHDPEELPASFHRVRDLVLQQYLPLVFWDEFDTPLGGAAARLAAALPGADAGRHVPRGRRLPPDRSGDLRLRRRHRARRCASSSTAGDEATAKTPRSPTSSAA